MPKGRFDLPLPRGSLYFADTPYAAALERCGRYLAAGHPVMDTLVEGRVISALAAKCDNLGNLTDQGATLVGVTREINTLVEYQITSTWAIGAYALGMSGLAYFPRFSTSADMAYAVFGESGSRVSDSFYHFWSTSLSDTLQENGVAVSPTPSSVYFEIDSIDDIENR